MNIDKNSMCLYAVTDRTWLNGEKLKQQVEKAIEGGATIIQLREKELKFEDFLKEAIDIKEVCNRFNVPFIVNDDIEIAVKSNADGIHIGQEDISLIKARKIAENKIIGVSVQTVEQAVEAEKNGADYLGVGAVFNTSTKLDASIVSIETLKNICKSVKIPVVAIGGISEKNIMKLKGTGIDGVAVVSAIFSKEDIKNAAQNLLKLSKECIKE